MATKKELEQQLAEAMERLDKAMAEQSVDVDALKVAMDHAPVFHRNQAPKLWAMLDSLAAS